MLTRAGFELAPSGYRSAALPFELSTRCGLDSSTGRAADRYPEGASSNPAQVNLLQLTSAVSDYHEEN